MYRPCDLSLCCTDRGLCDPGTRVRGLELTTILGIHIRVLSKIMFYLLQDGCRLRYCLGQDFFKRCRSSGLHRLPLIWSPCPKPRPPSHQGSASIVCRFRPALRKSCEAAFGKWRQGMGFIQWFSYGPVVCLI